MKVSTKIFFLVFVLCFALTSLKAQSNSTLISSEDIKPDPKKEAMFLPYLAARHGGPASLQEWKKDNTLQYYKELWYFCESFHVKRDHLSQGISLDESIIDISRFESSRKATEEAIVVLPGFKDALVLLPTSQLIYKP